MQISSNGITTRDGTSVGYKRGTGLGVTAVDTGGSGTAALSVVVVVVVVVTVVGTVVVVVVAVFLFS